MEGIRFSQGVEGSIRHAGRRTGFLVAGAVAAMALIFAMVATTFYGPYRHSGSQDPLEAQQQVDQLKRENAALAASLTQLNESLLAGQRDLQNLRAQLVNAVKTAESLRHDSEQARAEAERSSSRNAQLLDESRDQEKLLAQARDEAGPVRVNFASMTIPP